MNRTNVHLHPEGRPRRLPHPCERSYPCYTRSFPSGEPERGMTLYMFLQRLPVGHSELNVHGIDAETRNWTEFFPLDHSHDMMLPDNHHSYDK